MRQNIQLAVGLNTTRASSASSANLVNLFAELQPGDSKAKVALYGTPGTSRFTTMPGIVMGMHYFLGDLFVVTKTNLYRVTSAGAQENLGAVTIADHCSMADNGTQLVFVDGTNGYWWSEDEDLNAFSGDGWWPSTAVAYLDGYFLFSRADSGQFFISDLLGVGLNALDFATAESAPDNTLTLLVDHREVWLFGEASIEVWYNNGDVDFPFARLAGAAIEKGIGARRTAAKMDNTVFWLGSDGIVYRAAGYAPSRISNHAVELVIASGDYSGASAYTYSEEGHTFYVLTLPVQNRTLVFDASSLQWHERSHITHGRHHGQNYCRAFNLNLLSDFQNSAIYIMGMGHYRDDGDQILRTIVTPPIAGKGQLMRMKSLELEMETGAGLESGQGSNPVAMLQFSDDGGNTWGNHKNGTIGKIGNYWTRVIWWQLGAFRERILKIVIADPIRVVIHRCISEMDNGRH